MQTNEYWRKWCDKCVPGRFLREGKTSGNCEIDQIIYNAQKETKHYYSNFEWIPFDRLEIIQSIGKGGFAIIHSAIWIDGKPDGFREKKRSPPIKVALKKLINLGSEKMDKALINELSYF